MSRFIIDENIPSSINKWLRTTGHEVIEAVEAIHAGASDLEIIAYAERNAALIVTLDQDFVRLYRRDRNGFGVIVIRTHPPTPSKVKELLSLLLSKVDIDTHSNELIFVTDTEIHIESSGGDAVM